MCAVLEREAPAGNVPLMREVAPATLSEKPLPDYNRNILRNGRDCFLKLDSWFKHWYCHSLETVLDVFPNQANKRSWLRVFCINLRIICHRLSINKFKLFLWIYVKYLLLICLFLYSCCRWWEISDIFSSIVCLMDKNLTYQAICNATFDKIIVFFNVSNCDDIRKYGILILYIFIWYPLPLLCIHKRLFLRKF